MYPQSQTGIEAVRPRCLCQHQDGAGARMGGMANTCECSINIVTDNKLKVLRGLSQKWQCSGYKDFGLPCHGHSTLPVERARLTHSLLRQRNMATPYVPRQGRQAVRRAYRCAGMRGWKKRRPSCNGVDRGCASRQHHPTRKRADVHLVFRHKRA